MALGLVPPPAHSVLGPRIGIVFLFVVLLCHAWYHRNGWHNYQGRRPDQHFRRLVVYVLVGQNFRRQEDVAVDPAPQCRQQGELFKDME